jgi:hypothetical protein
MEHCLAFQVGETEPFVCELLKGLPTTILDLEAHQIHTFYEAVCEFFKTLFAIFISHFARIIGVQFFPVLYYGKFFLEIYLNTCLQKYVCCKSGLD